MNDATPALAAHRLTRTDLAALAGGAFSADLIGRLRSAELSRNILLLEALRREAARCGAGDLTAVIDAAWGVLRAAQAARPDVVARLLGLPGFGLWAVECLARLKGATGQPSPTEVGHLAGFAAVAALSAGQPCRLRLPVRDGAVHLPTLGRATVPPGRGRDWVELAGDGRGAMLSGASWELRLPQGGETARGWAPARALSAVSHGLKIKLALEDADPYLSRLAPSPSPVSPAEFRHWQQRLARAWELLASCHREVAAGLAGVLTAVVPSGEPEPGRPVTATSGSAWGAVILSLPADEVSLAEGLTHEFHHLVLAAAEDIAALAEAGDAADLCYAPWRDDPRPRSALLQGSYAFLGVAGFWLRQSRAGPPAEREAAQAKFARRAENVADALGQLRGWAGLTPPGRVLVEEMAARAAALLEEPVDPAARGLARRANAEHRARWPRAGATAPAAGG